MDSFLLQLNCHFCIYIKQERIRARSDGNIAGDNYADITSRHKCDQSVSERCLLVNVEFLKNVYHGSAKGLEKVPCKKQMLIVRSEVNTELLQLISQPIKDQNSVTHNQGSHLCPWF